MTNLAITAAENYIKDIYTKGCHPTQSSEVTQAFISGMALMLQVTTESADNLPEDEAITLLHNYEKSFVEYFRNRQKELNNK